MPNIVVCARGGKPVYIADDIEDLTGYTAQEAATLLFASIAPHLDTTQNTFQKELECSCGRPFHSYHCHSILNCKDGSTIETDNTVCLIRINGDDAPLVISVIRTHCGSTLRQVMALWSRLSAASAGLVLNIVKSLARYAV